MKLSLIFVHISPKFILLLKLHSLMSLYTYFLWIELNRFHTHVCTSIFFLLSVLSAFLRDVTWRVRICRFFIFYFVSNFLGQLSKNIVCGWEQNICTYFTSLVFFSILIFGGKFEIFSSGRLLLSTATADEAAQLCKCSYHSGKHDDDSEGQDQDNEDDL